jgi:DNA-directed RNA polymerase delta subunit
VRDFAYLAVKKHGSPLHFREVASLIEKMFNRAAHVATTHNELIKDPRFVLVGRGMYALREWGYTQGVVRDVIREALRKQGPHDQRPDNQRGAQRAPCKAGHDCGQPPKSKVF